MSKFRDRFDRVVDWLRYHPRTQGFLLGVAATLALGLLISCGGAGPIPPADGQTVVDTLNWTNPTTRTDGSPLTNLATIRIQWGSSPGGPFNLGQVDVAAPATTRNITRAANVGTYCYVATAIDANGIPSAPSNAACKTVVANPNPPTGLTVS